MSGIDFRDKVVILGEIKPPELTRVCAVCQKKADFEYGDIWMCNGCADQMLLLLFVFMILLGSGFKAGPGGDFPFVPTANPRMNLAAFL